VRTAELDYNLPPALIARTPVEPRDACRLMVVSRSDDRRIDHLHFRDLPDLVRAGDLLVTNTSRVVPARIAGCRADTSGKVEGLFVAEPNPGEWTVLLKANTRLMPGHTILLRSTDGTDSPWSLELLARDGDGWRARVVSRTDPASPTTSAADILSAIGATPLPPYILAARKAAGDATPDAADRAWYQTVYADAASAGSVAAPTAGLHFTPDLLGRLERSGVRRAGVTLHVGIGTFKPIECERVEDHPIHAEHAEVPASAIAAMRAAHAAGHRVIAVGTTSVRAIESLPHPVPPELDREGFAGATSLFIRPGFPMRWTDGLITNFHLPRSTLLAMVGALFPGGVPRLLDLYREAIAREYRFYSYGDAMLILP
jgi:S-adenosylmethionine:tRNA ribosyltransferase-isomerase